MLLKYGTYLSGVHFIIMTGLCSLKYMLEQQLYTTLQQKWCLKLIVYDYEIQYKKGSDNVVADALSRILEGCLLYQLFEALPKWITDVQYSLIDDSISQELFSRLLLDPSATPPHYTYTNGLLRYKGQFYIGLFKDYWAKIFTKVHSSPIGGHGGIHATLQWVERFFY